MDNTANPEDTLEPLTKEQLTYLLAQANEQAKAHRARAKTLPAKSAAMYVKVAENYERLAREYGAKLNELNGVQVLP